MPSKGGAPTEQSTVTAPLRHACPGVSLPWAHLGPLKRALTSLFLVFVAFFFPFFFFPNQIDGGESMQLGKQIPQKIEFQSPRWPCPLHGRPDPSGEGTVWSLLTPDSTRSRCPMP